MDITIQCDRNNTKTLFTLCEEQGISLAAFCGRHGICGSCQIRLISGILSPSSSDKSFFSHKELNAGYRLACTAIPKETIHFEYYEYTHSEKKICGIDSFVSETQVQNKLSSPNTLLLIDIGTTTIALLLTDYLGNTIDTALFFNPQFPFGSDVISRLNQALSGKEDQLCQVLQEELRKQILQILQRNHLNFVDRICIAGNTIMTHFLLGYPTKTLAHAPFTPYSTELVEYTSDHTQITIFPSLSAFIGGDIISGMYGLNFESRTDTVLLIDLGTNGEMALVHNGYVKVTSVAAGPAFEGGNLSCGGPSIPGAISEVTLGGIHPICKTIDNKLPIHLCGTGALSLISELLKKGYIQKDGIATKKFPQKGILLAKSSDGSEIRFTLEDFRELQLALASLKAGYETLLYECALNAADIEQIFLAGSFGSNLIFNNERLSPMFPEIWLDRVKPIGNSCLKGLFKYGRHHSPKELSHFSVTSEFVTTVLLAEHPVFKKRFLQHLTFD